jgi:hypothetical protein
MNYVCPVCNETGKIADEDLEHPVTKTNCPHCRAILMVNPDSGNVDAWKSALKDAPGVSESVSQRNQKDSSVLEQSSQNLANRDWTAIVVFGVILLVLIAAGIYLFFNPFTMLTPLN